MSRPSNPPLPAPPQPGWRDIVFSALRAWRAARDCGASPKHRLHRLLSPFGPEMLGPMLDSLMALYEQALGRPLVAGATRALSQDEALLMDLLTGAKRRSACIACPEGAGSTFDCALCSARIMLALRPAG